MHQLKQFKVAAMAMACVFNAYGQNTLFIQQGTTVSLNSNVTFTISNLDLHNDGTLYPAAGQGRVVFTGNAINTIKGNGTTGFDQLEIAKTESGLLVLENNFNVRTGIWFTTGKIELNNRTITLLGNATLNNESENSYITGLNGGFVQLSMQLNNPQLVNPGNLGAVISSSQNLGQTAIRRGHSIQQIAPGQTSIRRFFDIVPANNNALAATLRFHYLQSELDNHIESALAFQRSSDQQLWTNEGMTLRNEAGNFVELQGINSFSRWTLAGTGAALPVHITTLNVRCENGGALVTWTTAQEFNSHHFEVQSSVNGTDWQTLGIVTASGNSNTPKNYSFRDLGNGRKFYRLKQLDQDGSIQYSMLVMAGCTGNVNWNIWPNPATESVMISMDVSENTKAQVSIYDSRGKLVKTKEQSLLPGNNQVQVNIKELANGIYHVVVNYDKGRGKHTTRILKQ